MMTIIIPMLSYILIKPILKFVVGFLLIVEQPLMQSLWDPLSIISCKHGGHTLAVLYAGRLA